MRYAIMVTGPAYGTQQASSALQFAHALLNEGHELASVFFYREGVYNANLQTTLAQRCRADPALINIVQIKELE
ncbi:hypothetical protein GFJ91_18795, partial [Salmonella enterica subsp. enterica serovar Enteritidis]|nr:hypothetical protein [Salmonella enterica subsp. enterica serovar Enteritidis]